MSGWSATELPAFIVDALEGTLSDEMQDDFAHWLAQPGNNQLFTDLQRIWLSGNQLNNYLNADVEGSWQRFQQKRIQTSTIPVAKSKTRPLFRATWAAAAAVLFFAAALSFWLVNRQPEYLQVASQARERTTIELNDGTTVMLNEQTTFFYPKNYTKKERRVKLERGSAYFEVARNEHKPFIVEAGNAQVQVLGTQFTVSRLDESVLVAVNSGKVQVTTEGGQWILTAGKRLELNTRKPSTPAATQVNEFAPFDRKLVFNRNRLDEVIKTLEEVYFIDIETLNIDPTKEFFTASFQNEDAELILKVICASLNLRYNNEHEVYILQPAPIE